VAVYRIVTLAFASALIIGSERHYAHPAGGYIALAVLAAWTVVTVVAYSRPAGRNRWLVGADVLVAGALIVSTRWIDTAPRIAHGAATIPTIWAVSAILACAVAGGPWIGMAAALPIWIADLIERRELVSSSTLNGLVLLLVEDQTESRRVEEVRRDFVANTSHELKTPVGALALLAETVEDAADDPEAVRRFASRMRQEAARLTNLVQDMITLSRIQAAEPIPDPVPVALDAVVAEALDRCRMKASARGIDLVAVGEHGLSVLGDEDLLVTALRNLLENAVAYSPDKTRVDVSTGQADDAVEISVSDQGIGIPERDLERIFERFYRVDPARSRATGGTGLGLAIVKHVTAAHGGKVTVVSSEGAGSTFTLRLPLRLDAVTVRRHRTGDGAIRQEAVK